MEPTLNPLFGWSAQTWLAIDQWGILLGILTSAITLLALVLGVLNHERLRSWLTRNRFPRVGEVADPNARRDAIVFTVSRPEVPVWVIEQLKPTLIGLLFSPGSRAAGLTIEQTAKDRGIDVLTAEVANADDPGEARRQVARLLADIADRGIRNLAVDITGGKSPMSIGAFMAAEEAQVDSLYVTTEYNQGRPRMETAKILCISQPI